MHDTTATATAMPNAPSLDALALAIAMWQRATFPHATPVSCAEHLRREADELAQALAFGNADDVAGEVADLFHLVVAVADRLGLDLADVVRRKLRTNRARTWGTPDAHGVAEHIDPDDATDRAAR